MINYSPLSTTCTLTVGGTATFAGDVVVPEYIKHSGDLDTFIRFSTNLIRLYTANSVVLTVDSSQNATFAGDLTVTGTDIRTGASNGLDLGDDSSILTIGRTNEMWTQQDVDADATLYLNYRGYNAAATRFRSFDIRDGKGGQIAVFSGTDKMTTLQGGLTVNYGGSSRLSITGDVAVVGATDFAIPQGRKLILDGAGGHTYIEEESDSNLKFYVAGSERLNITNTNATFVGAVISTDGTDTATLSHTGLVLSRSNSYIQSNADNQDTLNIGQSSVRWGHVKVDAATFKVLNGGTERFGIDSSGNATFAGNVTASNFYGLAQDLAVTSNDTFSGTYSLLWHDGADVYSSTWMTVTGSNDTLTVPTIAADLNGTINTATTGTTQSAGNNSTKIATTAYVDNAVAGAPQGTVTKSGTPVNNQLAVWTSATNIEGEPELTYDGSTFTVGGSGNTTTYLDVIGTNTAGAPATAAAIRIYGYEGRGEGIFYYDSAYASSEWYSGVPYGGGDTWQIGHDTGGQAEYTANALLRFTTAGAATFSGDIIIDNSSGDPFLKLKTSAQEYVLRIDQSDSEKLQLRNTTSSVTALSIDTSSNTTFAGTINLSSNKGVVWPGGSIRAEGNTLKLVATTLIDLQQNTQVQGTLTTTGNATFAGTGTFEGGGNTLTLKKGTGTPALAFAGTATDPQASALIEGIAGGGLKIYTSNGGTIGTPGWSPKFDIAAGGNATFAGDVTTAGDITINDTSGTRGISRNNTGYNLQLMGGTDNTDGAFISLSGETRGGTSNVYNGRIEMYSGGGGLTNQAACLGDIIFGTKWNGGSSNILVLDSSTNNATFAGNVTIPSYVYHSGDSNTYFGFSGNDIFQVNTAGNERMRITASGMKLSTSGATVSIILDEDNMSSNSATALATQQSIKAYVDNSISGGANYLGVWDPDDSLNNGYGNPSLQASTRTDDSGDYFICSADGAAHPNGGTTEPDSWHVGDWVIWNEDLGSSGLWQKIDNTTVLSGGGTSSSVAKFTDNETIGDGPIAFNGNTSVFFGNTEPSVNGSKDLGGASKRWATLYTNNISTSTSSTFGGDLVLDDHVDASPNLYFYNQANNYARLQFSTGDELVLKIGTSPKLTIGASDSSFSGKLAVNGDSVFADAELDVLGDITLINRNWALRGNNSNADFVIEKVAGNNFNDNNIAVTVSQFKNVGIGDTGPNVKLQVSTNSPSNNVAALIGDGWVGNSSYHKEGGLLLISGTSQDATQTGAGIAFQTRNTANTNYWKSSMIMDRDGAIRFTLGGAGTVAGSEDFTILSGGNVGIGTPSPGAKLDINNGAVTDVRIRGNQTSDARIGAYNFYNTAASDVVAAISADRDGANDAAALAFDTQIAGGGMTERMRITSTGNVGIGTDSPNANAKLHLYNSASATDVALRLTSNANSKTLIGFGDTVDQTAGAIKYDNATSEMSFEVLNSTEAMRIDSSGNVGIGLTNPSSKLTIETDAGDGTIELLAVNAATTKNKIIFSEAVLGDESFFIEHDGSGAGADNLLKIHGDGSGGTASGITIRRDGRVGIGTDSPAFKLDVDGTLGVSDLPGNVTSTSVLVRNETIGPELLSNPDFATDTIWGGSASIANGQLTKTGGGLAYQTYSGLVSGATYLIEVDVASIAGTANFYLGGTNSSALVVGKQSFYLLGGSTNALVGFNNGYSGSTGSVFNSVSLKLVTSASDQIQTRQLSSDIFTSGPFLPLAGGTMTGSVRLNDNVQLQIGSSNDAYITHNGTNTYFVNGVGDLEITNDTNDGDIIFKCDDGLGGTTEYFRLDGGESNTIFSRDLKFLDSGLPSRKLIFGTNNDLQMFHDGGNSYIAQGGAGDLYIQQNVNDKDLVFQCDNGSGGTTAYFYLDGSLILNRFLTHTLYNDNIEARFGSNTDGDLKIWHSGASSSIRNQTGHLYIQNLADDSDIIFQSDNGSGGNTEYFYLDGGLADGTNVGTRFPDQSIILLGSGNGWNDGAQIYHSGSNTHINNYVGDLDIRNYADNDDINFRCDDGSGGITTYFQLDGSHTQSIAWKDIHFVDGIKAKFGDYASPDLQIYHDGSNSYIKDSGTGDFIINTNLLAIQNAAATETMAKFFENGSVDLYYDDSKKFETSNAGVSITGSLSTTQDISVSGDVTVTGTTTAGGTLICEGNITVQDSDKLQLGNSQDLELYHASGVSYIDNDTGHLYIRNNVDNDDGSNIYIQAKSGENSILCQDDGAVGLYNNNVQKFSTNSTGAGAYGYIGFGSAGTSTGSTYGFRYGSSSPNGSQGIVITVSDTGGSYFDGVGRFQNTNTGQGAGMFQMVNYGSLYGRYMQFFRGSTSNIIGYIGYNNSNTSVTFSTTNSDIRTKKNITTWDENVLDKFKALQPKRFDFKVAIGDKGAVKERGFIAQYEKDNFPEAYQLNGNDEKATYGFHPMEMVPYMMKAIKDLTIKNEELERRIKTLES